MGDHVGLCMLLLLTACGACSASPEPDPPPVPSRAAPEGVERAVPLPAAEQGGPEDVEALRRAGTDAYRRKQFAQAAATWTLACDAQDAASCLRLSDLLENGQGVPEDLERARGLREMACAAGLNEACDLLGH